MLFKTLCIGTKYTTVATIPCWLTGYICWNENVCSAGDIPIQLRKKPYRNIVQSKKTLRWEIVTADLIKTWIKSLGGGGGNLPNLKKKINYNNFSKLFQLFRAIFKDQVFLVQICGLPDPSKSLLIYSSELSSNASSSAAENIKCRDLYIYIYENIKCRDLNTEVSSVFLWW